LSHLFFADDLTLIAKASVKSIHTISNSLAKFCTLSGQKINTTKSKALFSSNCDFNIKALVKHLLDISPSSHFGKYLGFPILNRKPKACDF